MLANPAAPPEGKMKTEELVDRMKDRSKPANAPAELRPTGRWQPGPELVNEFRTRRDRMIQYIGETKDPLTSTYGKWGPMVTDVYQALHAIPAHTERHLMQISEVKASAGYPKQ
jgi:hypothetical protein